MGLQYCVKDLQRWASFSGDENPIHFDAEAASALGLSEVVVHGMLAMLPLKAAVLEQKNAGAVKWSASLRNPLPLSVRAHMEVKNDEHGSKFKLLDQESSNLFIKGNFSREAKFSTFVSDEQPVIAVDNALLKQKYDEFRDEYPNISKFWVFLDAFVFFLYVRRNSQSVFAAEIQNYLLENDALRENPRKKPLVMHATHAVTISDELLSVEYQSTLPRISYTVYGKDMVKYSGSLYGVVEISVLLDDRVSMQVDLGLVARF